MNYRNAESPDPSNVSDFPLPPYLGRDHTSLLRELKTLITADDGDADLLESREFTAAVVSEAGRRRARAALDGGGKAWAEVDIGEALDNGIELPTPTVLRRADGSGLMYRGLPNVLFGDASAGKTSLAIATTAQELMLSRHVYCVNYETNINVWLARLLALGVPRTCLQAQFHYLDVHQGAKPPRELHPDASLVVIDSMTSALDALGAEPNDAKGVETVYRQIIDPFTDAGLAGFLIDHVGHADKSRPMNSIRKTGRVQGAMLRLDAVAGMPFGRGRVGAAFLAVHKDNQGGLDLPKGAAAGRFVMASGDGGASIQCSIETFNPNDLGMLSAMSGVGGAPAVDPHQQKRNDVLRVLQVHGEVTRTKIRELAQGKRDVVNDALDSLVRDGLIVMSKKKNADGFSLVDAA